MTEKNLSDQAMEEFLDALAQFMVSHDLLGELEKKGVSSEKIEKQKSG